MPLEIGLWRVDGQPAKLGTSMMPLESRLEELLETDPSMLGLAVLLIGRQVSTAHGKFIDLLGIDAEGTLHVLELKRDRTSRDVVAQVLDYGSWVRNLANEEVRAIYDDYARRQGRAEGFDRAFAEWFGATPPESLNTSHTLTVVASELDAATERIVTYLATEHQVPVNVLFFRYFEDEGRSYLARTWLMDEAKAANPAAGSPGRSKKEAWNGQDWYVAFGEEPAGRSWEDARRYGFVSAGGGDFYSRTLRTLPIGARVFVHIPQSGYVGVGTVTAEARPYPEVFLTTGGVTRRMAELDLAGTYVHADAPQDGQDRREWVVQVEWLATVPRAQALWKLGMFANQNSACRLRSGFSIDEATRYFKLDS
ncbi:endonuclease NucS domain-containing protein [Nonomuraea sp. NPDC050310]|uniref:endonuclease NucS domain-containing protein n=1 Tax=Nonomuraea sp. NPDC050310 TaxID=3154935 RepID=UPI0033FF9C0E